MDVSLVQDGSDADFMARMVPTAEKAYKGSIVSMAVMDVAVEALVGGDTSLGLADNGGTREVGRLRGETEKDLADEVIDIERIPRLSRWQGRSAALASSAAHVARVLWI
jgi:hypothetical protein